MIDTRKYIHNHKRNYPLEKAAIYHFTDKSTHRPKIYRDQLESLKDFAASVGFDTVDVFCDMSLKRSERTEFDRFLSCCGQYDALITKDFYHISENTGMCMSILKDLRSKGLKIFTPVNGSFLWEPPPFENPLRVATYTSHYGTPNEMKEVITVRNDISRLFINKETAWTISDQYYDRSLRQKDGEQAQLTKLLNNRDKFDLLLVHNLNDVHWRTAKFCKIREILGKDIYSLEEGFLKYRKS